MTVVKQYCIITVADVLQYQMSSHQDEALSYWLGLLTVT